MENKENRTGGGHIFEIRNQINESTEHLKNFKEELKIAEKMMMDDIEHMASREQLQTERIQKNKENIENLKEIITALERQLEYLEDLGKESVGKITKISPEQLQ